MSTSPRRVRHRTLFVSGLVPAVAVLAACGMGPLAGPAPATETVTATLTDADSAPQPAPTGFPLPTGFPVPSGSDSGAPGDTEATETPMESPTTTAATAPGATPSGTESAGERASGTTAIVDGRTVTGFPAGLVFPGGTKVDVVSTGDDPNSGTIILRAPAQVTLLNHFRALLPRAGYRVTNDTGGSLSFTGKGVEGVVAGNGSSGGVFTWGPAKQ